MKLKIVFNKAIFYNFAKQNLMKNYGSFSYRKTILFIIKGFASQQNLFVFPLEKQPEE